MDIKENDDIELLFRNDDTVDKKINKDLKEIKEKLSKETLSEEFKKYLKIKLNRYYKEN